LKIFIQIIAVCYIVIAISGCARKQEELTDTHNSKRLRDAVVGYMSEPMFRNKDFVQQITGTEADLKLYDMDEKTLYFAINKVDFDSNVTLNKLTIDRNTVEFGFEQNGDVFLGEYTLKGTSRLLFRIPKNDFKPDSSRSVTVKFTSGLSYTQSIIELADFADDTTVYGGSTGVETKKDKYMANHGAFISVKGEPSLNRFLKQIINENDKNEIKAQKILDFVTGEIAFSQNEAYGGYEILKRPNEVLMTGVSDCSGLTILYASLLEQTRINYKLVYFPGHIAVAVAGDFGNHNNLRIKHENESYSIAEVTVKGFRIGETILMNKNIADEITYIQKPGKDSKIINYKTGKPLE
jgi:hypothetical protein